MHLQYIFDDISIRCSVTQVDLIDGKNRQSRWTICKTSHGTLRDGTFSDGTVSDGTFSDIMFSYQTFE